jgi:flagellar biosynthesis chaperone FliJ
MSRIRRAVRLIKHFKRIRDEKAGELARVESRAMQKRREIEMIREDRAAAGSFQVAERGRDVDITVVRMASAYKSQLTVELERRSRELRLVEADVEDKRRSTTEAHRTQRIWEIVKAKLETAEKEYTINRSQKELDELAQQKRLHPRSGPPGGINRRTAW